MISLRLPPNFPSFLLLTSPRSQFLQHDDIIEQCKMINHELSLVATWLKANKLTLHPDKTKFIIFHPSRKKINSEYLTISIDDSTIQRVEHT